MDEDQHFGQTWEGDYGERDGFINALDQVNQSVDIEVLTGMNIFWSDVPYNLQLFAYVAFDPRSPSTPEAMNDVVRLLSGGGARLRTDITTNELFDAVRKRQLNMVGCVQGFPVEDPCQFATKSQLSSNGFDFSPWHSRTRTFLSHQSDRKTQVGILQMLLADRKIPTWMDTHDIEFGDPIQSAIERGIADSMFAVFWISEGFLSSTWCQYEFETFAHEYASRRRVTLLPVVEAGFESRLPAVLSRLKYLLVNSPGDPYAVAKDLAPRISRGIPSGGDSWS